MTLAGKRRHGRRAQPDTFDSDLDGTVDLRILRMRLIRFQGGPLLDNEVATASVSHKAPALLIQAAASMVADAGARCDDGSEAVSPQRQAEVDIFMIGREVRLVEASHGFPGVPRH